MPRKLQQIVDLILVLVSRDLKLKYKRSVIGLTWSLLNPLAQLLVFRFVFGSLLKLSFEDFTMYLFSGILVWNWFQGSLTAATGSVTDNGTLLSEPGFPTAVLPIAAIASNLVQFLMAFPILLGGVIFAGQGVSPALLAEPVVIFAQFVMTLSIGYLLAAVHVRFRDTQHLLGIVLMLGFYVAPTFYQISAVPEAFRGWLQLNPMVFIMQAHRDVLLHGNAPNWITLGIIVGASGLLLAISNRFFARAANTFVDEI
jgi:lipopolysaccharide transport system permease protein